MRPTRGLALRIARAVLRVRILRAASQLSGPAAGRASPTLLFGLAPRGVFRASDVATGAVGSYPTVSPLPVRRLNRPVEGFAFCRPPSAILTGGLVSVALSVAELSRIPPPGVTRRVALPFKNGGVRTFLQRVRLAAMHQRSPAPPAEIHYKDGETAWQWSFLARMSTSARELEWQGLPVARRLRGAYHFANSPGPRDAKNHRLRRAIRGELYSFIDIKHGQAIHSIETADAARPHGKNCGPIHD
jgi:hypothetical protein